MFDEVASPFPLTAMILAVEFDRVAVLSYDLGIGLDGRAGVVEDAVRAHLGRDQFSSDVVGTSATEGKDSGPHSQTRCRDDLLAGSQYDFFGVVLFLFGVVVVVVVGVSLLGAIAAERPPMVGTAAGTVW